MQKTAFLSNFDVFSPKLCKKSKKSVIFWSFLKHFQEVLYSQISSTPSVDRGLSSTRSLKVKNITSLTPGEGGHFVEMKNLELNFIMTKSRLTIMGL